MLSQKDVNYLACIVSKDFYIMDTRNIAAMQQFKASDTQTVLGLLSKFQWSIQEFLSMARTLLDLLECPHEPTSCAPKSKTKGGQLP